MYPLIIIEGPDGAGKSTFVTKLQEHLAKHIEHNDLSVTFSRQPGGSPIGETLRGLILDKENNISPMAQAFMFYASRAQILEDVLPKIQETGGILITDRFEVSTLAYQTSEFMVNLYNQYGDREFTDDELNDAATEFTAFKNKLEGINDLAMSGVNRKYIFIDANDDVLNERRANGDDRFESKGSFFQGLVRDYYREFFNKTDSPTFHLNGGFPFTDEVMAEAIEFITKQ